MKVRLGNVTMTRGAHELLGGEVNALPYLQRFHECDFGDTPKEDVEVNMDTLRQEYGTVMGSYKFNDTKFWIITNMIPKDKEDPEDINYQTYTTFLLPEEY